MRGSQLSERFQFGENWKTFLELLDEERVQAAEASLRKMLHSERLDGRTFLDVGSGSGLFSLAARRLGARVRSFDYDPQSVNCTAELKRRFFPDDPEWIVEAGSALDSEYLASLGTFDIVYSWGVLHHTGDMWRAMENVAPLVAPGGELFIAIYNDQGDASVRWKAVKRLYNRSPRLVRKTLVLGVFVYFAIRAVMRRLIRFENPVPTRYFAERKRTRGMSVWHDLVDWVGGYPFEVAKPEQVFSFYRDRGFELIELTTCGGGIGCNEYLFRKR
jgi:2-polyprenyl-3-methyl-5-hydroxy-6-metoxy-1,4-benzoquinol methylase